MKLSLLGGGANQTFELRCGWVGVVTIKLVYFQG